MLNDIFQLLVSFSLIISVTTLLVLMVRKHVRSLWGASAAYKLWLAIPAVLFISLVPFETLLEQQKATSNAVYAEYLLEEAVPTPVAQSDIERAVSNFFPQGIALPVIALWVMGVIASTIMFALRQQLLKSALSPLRNSGEDYYYSNTDKVGPALIGVLHPKIVVPTNFDAKYSAEEQQLILAHEHTHRRHRDPLINGIATLLQIINWFNPLVPYAAGKLYADQELACDAAVLHRFPEARKKYANTLLSAHQELAPNAFNCFWTGRGKHPFVERIQAIQLEALNGPKKPNSLVAFCMIAAVTMAASIPDWKNWLGGMVPAISSFASDDEMALITAARTGDFTETEKLLAQGVNPNISISPYGTPLIIAASNGDTRMAEVLIAHGAKTNLAARGQGFPLLSAVEQENISLVTQLLHSGAAVNALVPEMDASPLTSSSKSRQ